MSERRSGSGYTTKQIRDAPRDAWFVWCNNQRAYPEALARTLGRRDLRIISAEEIDRRLRGMRNQTVIVDHATLLDARQARRIDEAMERTAP